MKFYKIKDFDGVHELLPLICYRFGIYMKQGLPNVQKAALKILRDWNRLVANVEKLQIGEMFTIEMLYHIIVHKQGIPPLLFHCGIMHSSPKCFYMHYSGWKLKLKIK